MMVTTTRRARLIDEAAQKLPMAVSRGHEIAWFKNYARRGLSFRVLGLIIMDGRNAEKVKGGHRGDDGP